MYHVYNEGYLETNPVISDEMFSRYKGAIQASEYRFNNAPDSVVLEKAPNAWIALAFKL